MKGQKKKNKNKATLKFVFPPMAVAISSLEHLPTSSLSDHPGMKLCMRFCNRALYHVRASLNERSENQASRSQLRTRHETYRRVRLPSHVLCVCVRA